MPVYSMTGYGSGQTVSPGSERIHVEIRSVNNRFLDLSFKLPEELRALESLAREMLTASFKRGKLEMRAVLHRHAVAMAAPSREWLQALANWQAAIQSELPQASALSVADVLRLNAPEAGIDATALTEPFKAACAAAIDALRSARAAEGERLVVMLQDRIAQLRSLAASAAPLVPAAVAQQQQRFLDRYQEALQTASAASGSTVDAQAAQERAIAEAASYAMRIDVAEELTRLNAHLDEISALLAKGGELGKRLDFLIQELHREANTLGSKASSMELTRISVDMRVLVEQMREQVQNME